MGLNLNEKLDIFDESNDLLTNILLYADDIVLLTSNEEDMQFLLNLVEVWCSNWRLEVNLTKTNVMHVRGRGCRRSIFMFIFNKRPVEYCSQYRYLGVTLN